MQCDRCHRPLRGGYWVLPAPSTGSGQAPSGTGVIHVCRACCAAPRYPEPHAPTVEETRRLYAEAVRMLKAPNN